MGTVPLLAGLVAVFGSVLATPPLRRLYALEMPDEAVAVAVGACAFATVLAIVAALRSRARTAVRPSR